MRRVCECDGPLKVKARVNEVPRGGISALPLHRRLHFQHTRGAMLMAFTHQRPLKSPTYQTAWKNNRKINNTFLLKP